MSDALEVTEILRILEKGDMNSLGVMPWGSNYTFLVELREPRVGKGRKSVDADEQHVEMLGVYKPRRGEAPLWDFPSGTLCLREYAAYLVSEVLGWQLVPPTVLRDGEHGFGSVQLFIDSDQNQHFFTFREDHAACEQLQRMALFDLVTNNADRKSGHCLRDHNGHVWAIDHGICFNAEYKLRTVIWDFANQPIRADMLRDLVVLREQLEHDQPLGKAMRRLLDDDEIRAFEKRVDGLIKIKTFPNPNRYERSVPWPPV
jgi:uncharacterized repeat protein (TIGR03843 family)